MVMLIDVFKGANTDKMRSQNLTSEAAFGAAKQKLVSLDKTLPDKLVNRLIIDGELLTFFSIKLSHNTYQ